MGNSTKDTKPQSRAIWSIGIYVVVVMIAGGAAIVMSVSANPTWMHAAAAASSAVVLAAGTLFTALEMIAVHRSCLP
jgi:hypothetical protein